MDSIKTRFDKMHMIPLFYSLWLLHSLLINTRGIRPTNDSGKAGTFFLNYSIITEFHVQQVSEIIIIPFLRPLLLLYLHLLVIFDEN